MKFLILIFATFAVLSGGPLAKADDAEQIRVERQDLIPMLATLLAEYSQTDAKIYFEMTARLERLGLSAQTQNLFLTSQPYSFDTCEVFPPNQKSYETACQRVNFLWLKTYSSAEGPKKLTLTGELVFSSDGKTLLAAHPEGFDLD